MNSTKIKKYIRLRMLFINIAGLTLCMYPLIFNFKNIDEDSIFRYLILIVMALANIAYHLLIVEKEEKEIVELKDYNHNYYCSDSNFENNIYNERFENWEDFYKEWQNSDIDYSLIFRWDIRYDDENNKYSLHLYLILQRKGVFKPIVIENIEEEEISKIESYLKLHWKYVKKIWNPISNIEEMM